ncbi:MAG: NDP-sugar synthase, partial [Bacteroidota bacterium]
INLTVKSTASSMHSLFELRRFLEGRDFCLTTVDTIFKEDEFNDFINYCKNNNGKAVIAVTDYIDDEKPLYTRIDNDMNILSFDDEINGHTYVTGGIYYLPGTIFGLLEKLINSGEMHLRNFQRSLISAGYEVKAWPFTKIVDVDHISDIKAAEEFVSAYTKY